MSSIFLLLSDGENKSYSLHFNQHRAHTASEDVVRLLCLYLTFIVEENEQGLCVSKSLEHIEKMGYIGDESAHFCFHLPSHHTWHIKQLIWNFSVEENWQQMLGTAYYYYYTNQIVSILFHIFICMMLLNYVSYMDMKHHGLACCCTDSSSKTSN